MRNSTKYKSLAAIGAALLFLSACNEGPAEKAGENIDDAAVDVGNSIEDSCEEVKESLNAEDKDC